MKSNKKKQERECKKFNLWAVIDERGFFTDLSVEQELWRRAWEYVNFEVYTDVSEESILSTKRCEAGSTNSSRRASLGAVRHVTTRLEILCKYPESTLRSYL